MALNPNFNQIGEAFIKQYYAMFDNAATRPQLAALYNPEQSFLSFEGQQMQGTAKIMEKIQVGNILTNQQYHGRFKQKFLLETQKVDFIVS